MADLDDKIKQAANNLMMEQEGIPVDWDFCGKNFVAQIHKAFADEGYERLTTPVEGWQDMMPGLNIRTAPKKDPEYYIGNKRLMTGQEWFDRFKLELAANSGKSKTIDDVSRWVEKAAKRASGLDK